MLLNGGMKEAGGARKKKGPRSTRILPGTKNGGKNVLSAPLVIFSSLPHTRHDLMTRALDPQDRGVISQDEADVPREQEILPDTFEGILLRMAEELKCPIWYGS